MDKRLIFIAAASMAAFPALAADVGVSINIGEPGFYGRINLGDFPQPEVVYAQPVIVAPPPGIVVGPPVYLRVPPGHEKHWSKHCAEYHACGERVYFVRDNWYNDVYVPHYREHHEYGDEDHERHHEDRHDEHHDHEEHDHGHGHGHDHDHDER